MKPSRLFSLPFVATLVVGVVFSGSLSLVHSQESAPRAYAMGQPGEGLTFHGAMHGASSQRRVKTVTTGFVPKHEQWAASHGWRKVDSTLVEGTEVAPYQTESPSPDMETWPGAGDEPGIWNGMTFADDGCSTDFCEAAFRNWQLLGGVQGFTGPVNRGEQGSFGVYQGMNFGAMLPLGIPTEVGWQAGLRMTHSNMSGSTFTIENRNQIFLTTGVFHRVDRGLQWGVVIDWLHEDWYFEADLMQVRGEVSWRAECEQEFGIAFASGTGVASAVSEFRPIPGNQGGLVTESWQTTDWYVGFYRHRFGDCEENMLRAFAGFTSQSDGLVGAEAMMQINERWALQTGFTFLIPAESTGTGLDAGHAQEGWNLAMGLVWTPGCGTRERGYYSPLLNVADNGTFFVDRR